MKKLLIITAAMFATVSLYAQGTVALINDNTSLVMNSLTGNPAVAGTSFRVALYYAADTGTTPTDNDLAKIGSSAIIVSPGLFNAGTRTLTGVTAGNAAWVQVRAWQASFSTADYETALSAATAQGQLGTALFAKSAISRVITGNPAGSPPTNPAGLTSGTPAISAIILQPVPEPSVIGLGLLGIGALALLRRRK